MILDHPKSTYIMTVLLCVIKLGYALYYLRGNNDIIGMCRLCTQINARGDLWWYKNHELLYDATLQQIKIEYKDYYLLYSCT